MAKIKIYGSKNSSALRCYWALHEMGLEYEVMPLSFKDREHKSDEYLRINPNGKVPTLIDEEKHVTLWESGAINYYLARQYKPEFLGNGAEEEAQVMQWSFWALLELQKPIMEVFYTVRFGNSDQEIIKTNTEKFFKILEVLDKHLDSRHFMVGEKITLADINVGSVVCMAYPLQIDISQFANVSKWLQNMTARPAFMLSAPEK